MFQPTSLPDLAALEPVLINNDNLDFAEAVDAFQLLSESDAPFSFLVQGLLHRTGVACIGGSVDAGKSCLMRQLALAVVAGDKKFLGWKLNVAHRSAIYVTTEDGREATRCLLREQVRKIPKERLSGLRFVFDDTNLLANLDRQLTTRPADLVVIDCFVDAYGGDLRFAQRVRRFLHHFQLLAEKHQCLVVFVHHTDKEAEELEPETGNLLDNEGLEAKMRLVLELRKDKFYPQRRHLCVVKGSYLPADAKRESYVLEFKERTKTYTNTNERTPFDLLAIEYEDVDTEVAEKKYWEAYRLKREGLSYREIAAKMGYSAKSSIAAIFQRGRDENWIRFISAQNWVDQEDNEDG